MNIKTFWELINDTQRANDGNISKQADLLVEKLRHMSDAEILAFDKILEDLMNDAYDAALWDAAYIIGCGCSDDGFYEFRGWLIAQGKEVYEKALSDPESLVDLIEIDETAQQGHLLYVSLAAYEQKTGQEMPPRTRKVAPLKGTLWEEEDKNARFPKLAAKFGDCDQRDEIWFDR